jgi:catalase
LPFQAGLTYRAFDEVERTELISNLVDALKICHTQIQDKMIGCFTEADPEYGRRVKEGLEQAMRDMEHFSTAAADRAAENSKDMGLRSDGY